MKTKVKHSYWNYIKPESDIERSVNLDIRSILEKHHKEKTPFNVRNFREELTALNKDYLAVINTEELNNDLREVIKNLEYVGILGMQLKKWDGIKYIAIADISAEKTFKDLVLENMLARCEYEKIEKVEETIINESSSGLSDTKAESPSDNVLSALVEGINEKTITKKNIEVRLKKRYVPPESAVIIQFYKDGSFSVGRYNPHGLLYALNGSEDKKYITGHFKKGIEKKEDTQAVNAVYTADLNKYAPITMNELVFLFKCAGLYHEDRLHRSLPPEANIDKKFFDGL